MENFVRGHDTSMVVRVCERGKFIAVDKFSAHSRDFALKIFSDRKAEQRRRDSRNAKQAYTHAAVLER